MAETHRPPGPPPLLSPWRRRCQWLTTLLLLAVPWLQVGGNSLFRIDIPGLKLYFFGQTFRIEELYLVLLFSLAATLAFLLTTMVLGRVWCGWLCPQTTLSDLAEWFVARLGMRAGKGQKAGWLQKTGLQALLLLLACLVAANLLWYFIEPRRFFTELFTGELHYAATIFLLTVAAAVYLDMALVRRLFCKDFCPYGRFQAALADDATLALQLPSAELARCIECGSCVRACPMGIDIRRGDQIECINCGRCLDACRQVMARRGQPGLIGYAFGTGGAGPRALLNLRTLLLGTATLAMIATLAFSVAHRPEATLKIAVSHTAAGRTLRDGRHATFFNAWVQNRGESAASYRLAARRADDGSPLALSGQTEGIELTGGENRRVDFVLVTETTPSGIGIEFILVGAEGAVMASASAHLE